MKLVPNVHTAARLAFFLVGEPNADELARKSVALCEEWAAAHGYSCEEAAAFGAQFGDLVIGYMRVLSQRSALLQ